ncbi:hypothetical protein ACQPZJ_38130 [Actinoplanes sp. CA-054009]
MPFTDYFLAPDDAIAVTALGDGGPLATELPTVEAKGVDPVVNLGRLEEILTGRPYADVVAQPRQGKAVSDGATEQVIVAVTDSLRDALAAAAPGVLEGAGARLAATEELAGADPDGVTDFVRRLAGLAGRADGWRLYCYWAL